MINRLDTAYSQVFVDPALLVSNPDVDVEYRQIVRDRLVEFAEDNDCELGEGVVTRTVVAEGDSDVSPPRPGALSHIGYYRYRASAPMWRK